MTHAADLPRHDIADPSLVAQGKARIEDVKPLSNVVEITKQLFEVSKVK